MYGMGGFGSGGFSRGPGFDQAVGNHFSGMMQGGNSYGGGMGYGEPPQPGYYNRSPWGAPVNNDPGYGGPQPAPRPMPMPGYFNGGFPMPNPMPRPMPMPGYGGMPSPDGGPAHNPGISYGSPPSPDGGPAHNPGISYGGYPSPDGGSVPNPGNMARQFANGDPFHNARGNLRMRFRNPDPSAFYQSGGF